MPTTIVAVRGGGRLVAFQSQMACFGVPVENTEILNKILKTAENTEILKFFGPKIQNQTEKLKYHSFLKVKYS